MIRWSSSAKQEIRLLSLLLLLILCLFALSLGLDSLHLQRGARLVQPDRVEAEPSESSPQASLDDPHTPWVTLALASAAMIIGGIGLIVSRRMRRTFLMYLYGGLVFLGTFVLVAMALSNFTFDLSEGISGRAVLDRLPEAPAAVPSRPLIRATAIALFVVAVGAGVLVASRLRRSVNGNESSAPLLLDTLIGSASAAARGIRQGEDPHGAVIDCYRRMLRLLEEQGAVSHAYLTPREFAQALRDQGMPLASVERLTDLFELVRYGGRSGSALAQQAAECLEAVSHSTASPAHAQAPLRGDS